MEKKITNTSWVQFHKAKIGSSLILQLNFVLHSSIHLDYGINFNRVLGDCRKPYFENLLVLSYVL